MTWQDVLDGGLQPVVVWSGLDTYSDGLDSLRS